MMIVQEQDCPSPTFRAIAGAQVTTDRPIDGASVLPYFAGQPVERRVTHFRQYAPAIGGPKIAMRDGDEKIPANAAISPFELYNLRDNPSEMRNLDGHDYFRMGRYGL